MAQGFLFAPPGHAEDLLGARPAPSGSDLPRIPPDHPKRGTSAGTTPTGEDTGYVR